MRTSSSQNNLKNLQEKIPKVTFSQKGDHPGIIPLPSIPFTSKQTLNNGRAFTYWLLRALSKLCNCKPIMWLYCLWKAVAVLMGGEPRRIFALRGREFSSKLFPQFRPKRMHHFYQAIFGQGLPEIAGNPLIEHRTQRQQKPENWSGPIYTTMGRHYCVVSAVEKSIYCPDSLEPYSVLMF